MHSINFRFISRILGMMCFVEGAMMLIVLIVALLYQESPTPWIITIGVFFFVGALLLHQGYKLHKKRASRREGMLAVTSVWLLLSAIGMLPFLLTGALTSPWTPSLKRSRALQLREPRSLRRWKDYRTQSSSGVASHSGREVSVLWSSQ